MGTHWLIHVQGGNEFAETEIGMEIEAPRKVGEVMEINLQLVGGGYRKTPCRVVKVVNTLEKKELCVEVVR